MALTVFVVLYVLNFVALVIGASGAGAAACTPPGSRLGLSGWLLFGGGVFLAGDLVLDLRALVLYARGLNPAEVAPSFVTACFRRCLRTLEPAWFTLGAALLSLAPEACAAEAHLTWIAATSYLVVLGLSVLTALLDRAYQASRAQA